MDYITILKRCFQFLEGANIFFIPVDDNVTMESTPRVNYGLCDSGELTIQILQELPHRLSLSRNMASSPNQFCQQRSYPYFYRRLHATTHIPRFISTVTKRFVISFAVVEAFEVTPALNKFLIPVKYLVGDIQFAQGAFPFPNSML